MTFPHPPVAPLMPRRFRAVHEEVAKLDQDFGPSFSGVLTNDQGDIRGM